MLSQENKHSNDENIEFQETGHIYKVKKKRGYKSITTVVHNAFEKFDADKIIDNMMSSDNWETNKYYGMTKAEIKKLWKDNGSDAANLGTTMHYLFEYHYNNMYNTDLQMHPQFFQDFMNNTNYKETIEYNYFKNFVQEHPDLNAYRTEWAVYDEKKKIAGSIDMVFKNNDGTLSIYDWKRTKKIDKFNNYGKFCLVEGLGHIPDCNYWHYCLQLNLYKMILETNYGFKVKDLHLVVIHPENEIKNYEKIKLPFVSEEHLSKLINYSRSKLF
jgi:ATP-dependent exoDNAse (exonuclease V) beta subunit